MVYKEKLLHGLGPCDLGHSPYNTFRLLKGVNNVSHGEGPRTCVFDHVIIS